MMAGMRGRAKTDWVGLVLGAPDPQPLAGVAWRYMRVTTCSVMAPIGDFRAKRGTSHMGHNT
jgi:hypothetical protein